MSCTHTVKPGDDLRGAIMGLKPGGTLCFEAGRYAAPIRVEQSATLRPATPGAEVVLDAGGKGEVFATAADEATIVLEGLVLTGGSAGEAGGAVRIDGGAAVTIRGCVIRDNKGGSYGGGAIFASQGSLVVERSRVIANQSERHGAAILIDGTARVELVSSLVAENRGPGNAAIEVSDGATFTLRGSTVAGNVTRSAIAVRGTTTRAPQLEVRGSIVAQPKGAAIEAASDPPRPKIAVRGSVIFGTLPILPADPSNRLDQDPRFAGPGAREPWRPAEDSPARGLVEGGSTETDLLGKKRPVKATAGAFE